MEEIEINWETFESIVWIPVLTTIQMADILKVSKRTLERRVLNKYGCAIGALRHQKQSNMRHILFKKQWDSALSGNTTMQIWLGKQYLDQSEKVESTVISEVTTVNLSDLSEGDLASLESILKKLDSVSDEETKETPDNAPVQSS